MNDRIYNITLADGTKIKDLSLNGNNFISSKNIDVTTFEDNCSRVIISDGEKETVKVNMEFVQINKVDEKYWFVLRPISEKELNERKLRSDLEYMAMMCDVEL